MLHTRQIKTAVPSAQRRVVLSALDIDSNGLRRAALFATRASARFRVEYNRTTNDLNSSPGTISGVISACGQCAGRVHLRNEDLADSSIGGPSACSFRAMQAARA